MKKRRLWYALAAVAAALVSIPIALGHDVLQQGTLYKSGDICVTAVSDTRHGPYGVGEMYGSIESDTSFLGISSIPGMSCSWQFPRPSGYIAGDLEWWFWSQERGQWELCATTGYQFNSQQSSYWTYGGSLPSYPPCGVGWYGTYMGAYVWNGAWYGGWLWSGYHFFPAT